MVILKSGTFAAIVSLSPSSVPYSELLPRDGVIDMNNKDGFECSHPPCVCAVLAEGEFCSTECKDATQSVECFCGHDPCLIDDQSDELVVARTATLVGV